jgi:cyclic pyranopterin phosphate synthase
MFDTYNRQINYLRIAVTDRCNLRCTYCMPEAGIKLKTHAEILPYEKIVDIAAAAAKMGIRSDLPGANHW